MLLVTQWEYAEIYWRSDPAGRGVWWLRPDGQVERLGDSDGILHLNRAGQDGWEVVAATETRMTALGSRRIRRYTLRRANRD